MAIFARRRLAMANMGFLPVKWRPATASILPLADTTLVLVSNWVKMFGLAEAADLWQRICGSPSASSFSTQTTKMPANSACGDESQSGRVTGRVPRQDLQGRERFATSANSKALLPEVHNPAHGCPHAVWGLSPVTRNRSPTRFRSTGIRVVHPLAEVSRLQFSA